MMVYKVHLIYLVAVWSSLALGRPLETSESEQLTDSYEVSSEQSIPSSTPPTNQIGKSCSFDKESDRYVCTDSVPHELEEVCSPDDPKCLIENIQDLKSTKNDSKTKPCNVGLNAYCNGRQMPNGKRNNFEISEKLSDQERLLCNYDDAICLLRNRKALRTLNRLKRKLDLQKLQKKINTGNTGLAHDCSPSNNDSRCKRSTESTSIKNIFKRQAKKIPCKTNTRDKWCRWRPQPLAFVETRRTHGMDWQ